MPPVLRPRRKRSTGLGTLNRLSAEIRILIFGYYFDDRYVVEYWGTEDNDLGRWQKDYDTDLLAVSKQLYSEASEAEANSPVILEMKNMSSTPPDSIRKAAIKMIDYCDGIYSTGVGLWQAFDHSRFPAAREYQVSTPDFEPVHLRDFGGDVDDFFHGRLNSKIIQYARKQMKCPRGEMPVINATYSPKHFSIEVSLALFCGYPDDVEIHVVSAYIPPAAL